MYEMEGPHPNPAPQSRRSLGITAPQSPPLTPNLHGAPVSRSPCRARRCHRETPKSPGLDLAYLVVSAVLLPQPTAAQEANGNHLMILWPSFGFPQGRPQTSAVFPWNRSLVHGQVHSHVHKGPRPQAPPGLLVKLWS